MEIFQWLNDQLLRMDWLHWLVRQVLKFDLRNYAYDGAVLGVAARLYQGQTTNFRTPVAASRPCIRGLHRKRERYEPDERTLGPAFLTALENAASGV
jgi:hypothetical protein